MTDRSSRKPKREHDFNVTAFRVLQEATAEPEAAPEPEQPEMTAEERRAAAKALGSRGGKKGGPARAAKLTAEERSAIAKKAAAARWSHKEQMPG
jgi:hypothetical protein